MISGIEYAARLAKSYFLLEHRIEDYQHRAHHFRQHAVIDTLIQGIIGLRKWMDSR